MAVSDEKYQGYVKELEDAIEIEKQRSGDLAKSNYAQQNLFNQENEDNLIKWQLDMREDLDRLYHLLKGDIIKEDEDGDVDYAEPDDPNLKPFNEFGVQLIMNVMSFYLNRNTILSNYDLKTIEWKIYDFGIEVSDLIHNRYNEMMLTINILDLINKLYDTPNKIIHLSSGKYVEVIEMEESIIDYVSERVGLPIQKSKGKYYVVHPNKQFQLLPYKWVVYLEKLYNEYPDGKMIREFHYELPEEVIRKVEEEVTLHVKNKLKLYPLIVKELVDTVHSAYLRAYNGGERESLRTARTVTQNEPLNRYTTGGQGHGYGHKSLMKPWTWMN